MYIDGWFYSFLFFVLSSLWNEWLQSITLCYWNRFCKSYYFIVDRLFMVGLSANHTHAQYAFAKKNIHLQIHFTKFTCTCHLGLVLLLWVSSLVIKLWCFLIYRVNIFFVVTIDNGFMFVGWKDLEWIGGWLFSVTSVDLHEWSLMKWPGQMWSKHPIFVFVFVLIGQFVFVECKCWKSDIAKYKFDPRTRKWEPAGKENVSES